MAAKSLCELYRKTVATEFSAERVGEELHAEAARVSAAFDPDAIDGDAAAVSAARTLQAGIAAVRTLLSAHGKGAWLARALKKPAKVPRRVTAEALALLVRDAQFALLPLQLFALTVARQAAGSADVDGPTTLLWVDDHPEDNAAEADAARTQYGVGRVLQASRSSAAREFLAAFPELKGLPPSRFRVVTDLHRDDEGDDAGRNFIEWLRREGWTAPVLIFCRRNEAGIPIQQRFDNVLLATKQGQLYLFFESMADRFHPPPPPADAAAAEKQKKKKPPARSHKKKREREEEEEEEVAAAAAAAPSFDESGDDAVVPLAKKHEAAAEVLEGPPADIPEMLEGPPLPPTPPPPKPPKYAVENADSTISIDGPMYAGFSVVVVAPAAGEESLPPKWESLRFSWTRRPGSCAGDAPCTDGSATGAAFAVEKGRLRVLYEKLGIRFDFVCEYDVEVTNTDDGGKAIGPAWVLHVVPGSFHPESSTLEEPLPSEVLAGNAIVFRATMRDKAKHRVLRGGGGEIMVRASAGPESVAGEVKEVEPGVCECVLPLKKAGRYVVDVQAGESKKPVAGSPFRVTVRPASIHALEVKGIEAGQRFVAGVALPDLCLTFRDIFLNEITTGLKPDQHLEIGASKGARVAVGQISLNPLTGHTIVKGVSVVPAAPGEHELVLSVTGCAALRVPVAITAGKADSARCELSGPALAGRCRLGELCLLRVSLKDACGLVVPAADAKKEIRFSCEGPAGSAVPGLLKEAGKTAFGISFFPVAPGRHVVSITVEGKHVAKSPFELIVTEEGNGGEQDDEDDSAATQPDPLAQQHSPAKVDAAAAANDDADTEPDLSPEVKPATAKKAPVVVDGDDECAPTLLLDALDDPDETQAPAPVPEKKKTPPKFAASGVDLPPLPLDDF